MALEKTHGRNYDLARILAAIDHGEVVLPEFQRDFVWDDTNVRQLLATCLTGWPIGSLLLLPGTSTIFFKVREIEGAPKPAEGFQFVVLDGQQRLTSLYQALYGRGDFLYGIRWNQLQQSQSIEELEDAVVSHPVSRWLRDYPDARSEFEAGLIPVNALRRAGDFFMWRDAATDPSDPRRNLLTEIYVDLLSGLDRYEVPAVVIDEKVHPEAVARIFERVNRLGQPLGTFDLMVAKSFSENFNLRQEWENAQETRPRLAAFLRGDGLPILSTIALQVRDSVRQQDVLALTGGAVRDYWHRAVEALDMATDYMQRRLAVLQSDWLPYKVQLPILGCLAMNGALPQDSEIVPSWFWTSIFRGRYDVASNTRAVEDFNLLLRGEQVFSGDTLLEPETVLGINRRQYGSLHRGLLCLFAAGDIYGIEDTPARPSVAEVFQLGTIDPVPVSVIPKGHEVLSIPGHLLTLGMVLVDKRHNLSISDGSMIQPDIEALQPQLLPHAAGLSPEGFLRERLKLVQQAIAHRSALPVRFVESSD